VLQNRVAQCSGQAAIRQGDKLAVCLREQSVVTQAAGFFQRGQPGVNSQTKFIAQRCMIEMTIASTNVQKRLGEVNPGN
jgi:transketolase C-terminal domain/subunit